MLEFLEGAVVVASFAQMVGSEVFAANHLGRTSNRRFGVIGVVLGFLLAYLWFRYHLVASMLSLVILATVPLMRGGKMNTLGRAGIPGLLAYMSERTAYRRRLSAELGISVRELMKKRDLVRSDARLRSAPLDIFKAVWRRKETTLIAPPRG